VTDFIDRASAREAEMMADLLARQQRRAGLDGKTAADSAAICEDCGEAIPAQRRAAYPGVRLCVECKALDEARERMACVRS